MQDEQSAEEDFNEELDDSSSVVDSERWETFSYRSDDALVVSTFDVSAGDIDRESLPYCARIIIPIANPRDSGGPTDEEAEVLWQLEDDLTAILDENNVACRLVARLTHSGERELVFQLADYEEFRPPVGAWMETIEDYEFSVSEHDGWEFFDEFCWPSDEDWCIILDRHVIMGLIDAGTNPDKEHTLDFSFRGAPEQLKILRENLLERGYEDSPTETSEPGTLQMVRRMPLSLELICPESIENMQLCENLEIEFEGWGAGIEE